MLVWVIFYIHGLSSNINTAKNTNKINIIHKKLNNISKLVKEGHSLHDLTINDINKSSVYVSADVKKHFTILWNKIYETEPNFSTNKGLILKTYNIIQMKKDKLLDMIKYISNIDCFHSIGKLCQKY